MIRVGLTGGIGSGKSSVAAIFRVLGIPVFEADKVSKGLLASNASVISQVKTLLGDDVYDNGEPQRKLIAEIVFNDEAKLQGLNQILHPAVFEAFESWAQRMEGSAPYCIKEAAILFESGGNENCDKVICVSAPEDVRIERVMARDQVSKVEVETRIRNQSPQEEIVDKSDYIIDNGGSAVIPQVMKLHELLSQLE